MYQGTYIARLFARGLRLKLGLGWLPTLSYAQITRIRIRKTLNMYASRRSLYGAKQVRRVWNRTISNVQKQLGYDSIEVDSRLFVKKNNGDVSYIVGIWSISSSWRPRPVQRHPSTASPSQHWNLLEGKWVQITLLGHDHAFRKREEAIIVVKLKNHSTIRMFGATKQNQ